jgi:hypothetical protein
MNNLRKSADIAIRTAIRKSRCNAALSCGSCETIVNAKRQQIEGNPDFYDELDLSAFHSVSHHAEDMAYVDNETHHYDDKCPKL